jgi:hypothetical protein
MLRMMAIVSPVAIIAATAAEKQDKRQIQTSVSDR